MTGIRPIFILLRPEEVLKAVADYAQQHRGLPPGEAVTAKLSRDERRRGYYHTVPFGSHLSRPRHLIMPYLTQDHLNAIVDLPVSLPLADLYPKEWLVISTVQISTPQALTLRWLQAFIITSQDPSIVSSTDGSVTLTADADGSVTLPPQTPQLVTAGLGLAFVGLYREFNPLNSPAFQAAQESPLVLGDATSAVPVAAIRPLDPVVFSAAGAYSFVICNNTSNRLLRTVVNGQIRASLGFTPAS